ncbi:hypothetical protein AN1121.2 [Aspergillus nidulans FGSC A4]|uniref:Uncharacterized protein n=1 Tax=Emericella nidulans (strain FGSC A4 / ATCC 38163 / CBS 112.46 / NRRL 194 / M139) TaxID=227321 RepID=Q5BEA9_EMENI|nr:hypothetical protein [Aspergillus nidulans FGSC A4]EAA66239.1 hypothetical protein AN1121.2 [Aspergillus nidulans FGSC A4]CBF88098.1 TPA: conserved hypothetical protein [Aspergillus nidulans FGSC A4]|eukprot:XP_658725.1 hypothetical protein AN1121.2 [Aspergillus nidulans FGSC A4]
MKGLTLAGQRAPKPDALICQLCQISVLPAARYRSQTRSYASATKASRRPQIGQCLSKKTLRTPLTTLLPLQRYKSTESNPAASCDFKTSLREIEHGSAELRNAQTVPANDAVVQLLQKCLVLAEAIVKPDRSAAEKDSEISSLLNLEERNMKKTSKATKDAQINQPSADALCRIVHTLLTDEKIFISPEALSFYVKIHTLLKRPEHFPLIFQLYANKPIPEEGSSPIKYLRPNPKSINSAIPVDLANMALDVAIEQRNLALVLAIIDNTFCTSAFQRAKFFKKAAAPLGALAMTPLGCYVAASWAASFQNTMEPSTATAIAFAATLAYVGGTSSVGLMAILTANDHMERVVWIPGVPLRERWLREEERAALDRVALAWGFKDIYMRGEEEGEEWESLREFIGMRGMILDKTDLMQGMQ